MPLRAPYNLTLALLASHACSGPNPVHEVAVPHETRPAVDRALSETSAPPALTARVIDGPAEVIEDPKEAGSELGRYSMTYYWVAEEAGKPGKPTVSLRDRTCSPIAVVNRAFSKALLREGTGKLEDGRVVNVSGGCRCKGRCFVVADKDSPFGYGAAGRSLVPFRSVAAPKHIAVGTILYVEELDGLAIPGGGVHNGCVAADDRGGGVTGRQIDLFLGKRSNYKLFYDRHGIRSVSLSEGGQRCPSADGDGIPRGEG